MARDRTSRLFYALLVFGIVLFDLSGAVAGTALNGTLTVAGATGIAIEIDASVPTRHTID